MLLCNCNSDLKLFPSLKAKVCKEARAARTISDSKLELSPEIDMMKNAHSIASSRYLSSIADLGQFGTEPDPNFHDAPDLDPTV
jgi:hypothetical protein